MLDRPLSFSVLASCVLSFLLMSGHFVLKNLPFSLTGVIPGSLHNDMYSFNPASSTWTTLAPSGAVPSARLGMGFTSTPDGLLYLFGGLQAEGGGKLVCDYLRTKGSVFVML